MRKLSSLILLIFFVLNGCTGKKEHKNVFDPSYDGNKGGIGGNVTLSGSSNPDYNDIKITLQKGKNELPFTTTADSNGSFTFTITNTYYNESLSIGTFDKTDNVTKFNITDTTMQLGTILM